MPRNGSGIYQLPTGNPVVTGTPISSTTQNTTMTDVANALTTSISTDGQTPMAANLPMAGFRLTGLGSMVSPGDSARYEDVVGAGQIQTFTAFTTAGAAPAFTLTPNPTIANYLAGQRFNVTFNAQGTAGSNTIAISSLTAKNLKKYDVYGVKQPAYIVANMNTDIVYDGTDFIVLNPLPIPYRLAPNFANSGALVAQRTTAGTLSTSRVIGQCDNIGVWASGGAVSAGTITQVVAAISGISGFACRAAGVTLTGSGQISHSIRMEANDAVKYKNQTVSFSVKVDHNVGLAVNYTLVAKKPTIADNFASTTTIATSSTTSVATATGTLLTFNNVTIGDVSNGLELEVQAACGAVTTKNFNATEFYVAMEATAGVYDAPDTERELARCRRYLPSFTAQNTTDEVGFGGISNSSTGFILFSHSVQPRVPPTGLIVSPGTVFTLSAIGVTAAVATSISISFTGIKATSLSVGVSGTPFTVGNTAHLYGNTTGAQLLFTGCELL